MKINTWKITVLAVQVAAPCYLMTKEAKADDYQTGWIHAWDERVTMGCHQGDEKERPDGSDEFERGYQHGRKLAAKYMLFCEQPTDA